MESIQIGILKVISVGSFLFLYRYLGKEIKRGKREGEGKREGKRKRN